MITYIDTTIFDNIFEEINANIVRNLYEYQISNIKKQAVVHAPFPRHLDFIDLESKFNEIYDSSHKIFLMVSELHDVTVDFIEKFDRPNIIFFLNGDLNFTLRHARAYHWLSWFDTTTEFYKKNLFILDKLNPYMEKSKYFDISCTLYMIK